MNITGREKSVTADTHAKTERKQADEKLRESEERFRMMVESIKDYAIFMLDPAGRVVNWNAGAERLKGYGVEEIIGQHFARFYSEEDVVRGKPTQELATAAAEGRFENEDWRVRKDGSRFWASVVITAMRDEMGTLRGFAKVTRDITERKRAEEILRQKDRDLQERNDELTRFTYAVSHDLKSPIVTIKTFLGYLEQDTRKGDTTSQDKDLGYIRNAADKMSLLLDELLNLSRIGRKMHPSVEAPLQAIVKEALDLLAGQITQQDVKVQVTEEPILLYGDRPRLVEIFQNLVDNAVKFMGDQLAPCVKIGVEQVGEDTVFFVRDNGIGIDIRHQNKLFGLFEKLNPATEGTGIGLALVKRIVEVHGGKIWVESEGPGKGTTFRFTLAKTRRQPT